MASGTRPRSRKAPSKGGAARAEANGKPKVLTFRGIDIILPEKLFASFIFRAGRLRDDDVKGATRMIESIIGAEQFDKVLDKMDADGLTIDDVEGMTEIGELLNAALGAYGLSPGESTASQT